MKQFFKLLLVTMGLILITATFTSCKDDKEEEITSSIIGTWVGGWSDEKYNVTDIYTFNSNGAFSNESYVYKYGELDQHFIAPGTYVIKGNSLIITVYEDGEYDSYEYEYSVSGNILTLGKDKYTRK